MLVPLPSLKKLKTAQVLLLLRVILRLLVLNSSYWRWLYDNFSWTLRCTHKNRGKKMQWMYRAAISYATKKLQGPSGGPRVLLGILGGNVPRSSPNLDPFSDQNNVIFHNRFQAWPLNSIPILRPGLYEIMSSSLRLERQQKMIYLSPLRNRTHGLHSYRL